MKGIFQLGKIVLGLVMVAVMAAAFSHSAEAAPKTTPVFYVETTADNNIADNELTLREALLVARNGTENGTGLGRPLTDAEKNKLYNCSFTGYEPDHWWVDGNCGSQYSETIMFYLQGCPCTIAPTTALPYVPAGTTLDASTEQPGAVANSSKKGFNGKIMVSLYGGNIAQNNVIGLETGDHVTIKGLEIYGFSGDGIVAEGGSVTILGSVIDGNTGNGVTLSGSLNHLGSVALAGRNSIYENGGNGVEAYVNANANQIVNNLIGVAPDGEKSIGNDHSGIALYASSNYISGNTVANNSQNGIVVGSGIQNNFYNNSIHDNYLLGIDLGGDGVTANDGKAMDSDTGANNLQNYPTLKSANSTTHAITGKLVSTPNTTFQVDLFKSGSCDANHFGEGATHLGSVSVTTNASGAASFSTSFKFKKGNAITAVASGSEGTSEFSKCFIAQ